MNRNRYLNTIAFLDLLFNLVISLAALFLLAIMQIAPPTKKDQADKRDAIYLVVLRWDDNSNHDVDLWVTNGKETCGYRNRQTTVMSLDRDNVGPDIMNPLTHLVPTKEEVVSIRSREPGTYTVAAHWYSKRSGKDPLVRWQVIRVSDNAVLATGEASLRSSGEERTLIRFSVGDKGELKSVDTTHRYPFVTRN